MLVTAREVLRVIHSHRDVDFDFPIYSSETENGQSKTATMANRTYLPAGSLMARTVDARGKVLVEWEIDKLVVQMWDSLSCFKMAGSVICKRSAYKQPMISKDDSLFLQSPIEQAIEDDLVAQKTGRELVMPDLSEDGAASLMKEFAEWRQAGGE